MSCELLVASCHAAKPLQAVDATLHNVSAAIALLVESFGGIMFVGLVRNHRNDPMILEPVPNPVCRVAFVPSDLGRLLGPGCRLFQQGNKLLRLVLLTWTDGHRQRRPLRVTNQMKLGAEASLAASGSITAAGHILDVSLLATCGGIFLRLTAAFSDNWA